MRKQILLVEDEENIKHGIESWLIKENYEMTWAQDGEKAINLVKEKDFDLIILDIMVPKKDGYSVLEEVRKTSSKWIPIIMLSAKSDEDNRIMGLTLGADDYMTKPFSVRELIARMKAQLRFQKKELNNLNSSHFEFNRQNYTISNFDKEIVLTKKEIALLEYLLENKNHFVSKEELLCNVWNYEKMEQTRTVDIHISKLRKKLEELGCGSILETKNNVGYRIIDESN